MLPLCKQCISIHHKEHSTMSTPPSIIDIGYIVDRVNNDILTQREMLQKKSMLLVVKELFRENFKKMLKKFIKLL